MNRTVECLSGITGGVFGLVSSAILVLTLDSAAVTGWLWLGFLFSVLAIAGAVVVRSRGTAGGVMLLVAAAGVFVTVPMFNMVAALLILLAGVLGIVKKNPNDIV